MGLEPEALSAARAASAIALARLGHPVAGVEDIQRLLEMYRYASEWRTDYSFKGVSEALRGEALTCLDAAVAACELLRHTPCDRRGVLALHRRDAHGEECGHLAAVYRDAATQRWGAISKSSFTFLPNLPARYADWTQIAMHYGEGYRTHGIRPLYFGVHLEGQDLAFDDFLGDAQGVERLCDHILGSYQYEFQVGPGT